MTPINDAFPCPVELLELKQTNWAQTLWERHGVSLLQLIICLIGVTAGVIWIQLALLIDTLKQFGDFFGGNVKWPKKRKAS